MVLPRPVLESPTTSHYDACGPRTSVGLQAAQPHLKNGSVYRPLWPTKAGIVTGGPCLPTGIGNGKQSLITQVHPDWRFPVFVNQRLQSPFSATTHFDFPWPPNPSHIGTLVSGTRHSNRAIPRPRLGRSRLCREIPALGRSPGLYGNLDRLKTQPQPQGTGDPQQRCKGGVAVFRQRLVEVAPV